MPLNKKLKKVLVIGSGPIVIGQAAEFDYAGTQACIALKEEGIEVVLINNNPATIMTDETVADKVYIEPLNVTAIEKIIRKEKPDGIIGTLGGDGGGFAHNDEELEVVLKKGLAASPIHQVLVERSIKGWKEIEYEVMRD